MVSVFVTLVLVFLAPAALHAQFTTTLSADTNDAFEEYVRRVEQSLPTGAIWNDVGREYATNAGSTRGREIIVQPVGRQNPESVPGGLIHDWIGSAVIEHTTIDAVSAALVDFDRHQEWYPEVIQSKVLSKDAEGVTGEWIVRRKNVITVVLRVQLQTTTDRVSRTERRLISRAERISEIERLSEPAEREFPPGEGHGVLWRFNAYWRLRQDGNDVAVECRSVTLSRSVPSGLNWIINPLIRSIPRDTLESTLENTRKAVERNTSQ